MALTFFPGPINLLVLMLTGELGAEEAAIEQVASALLGPLPSSAGVGAGGGGDSSSPPLRAEQQAERAEVERALRLLWRHYGELGEGMRDYLLQSAITATISMLPKLGREGGGGTGGGAKGGKEGVLLRRMSDARMPPPPPPPQQQSNDER